MTTPAKLTDLFNIVAGTAAVSAVGGCLGAAFHMPAGGTALLCGLPLAVSAAVTDARRACAAATALGGVGTLALWYDLAAAGAVATSALAATSAFSAVALAASRRKRHETKTVGLERLNEQILAEVASQPEPVADACPSEEEVVGYATTLLGLQEAGRRIATHLDLDSLVPTVVTTARSSLKCREAAVYFWDGRDRSLRDAFAPRSRDAGRFVPDPSKGITKWVIENRQVLTAFAAESNPDLAAASAGDDRRPAGVAPLLAGNELLGLLVVDEPETAGPTFGRMLYILANLAALGIKNAQLFRRIEDSARRDALTGLLNRGGFEVAAEDLFDAARPDRPVSLLISDLDHFKRLNDRHGHPAGDSVLRETARLWRAVLPQDAILARYGGEEFVAALPGCDLGHARELAETLRETIAAHPFVHAGQTLSVTASFGVGEFDPADRDLEGLVRRTDAALYRAKAAGRNRVCAEEAAVTA
jgi:diguanylate cyclase (GGDEF)-like protein